MLTPAQHRHMSYLAKLRKGQNGKWETNERKANAKAVLRKTAKINPLFAKSREHTEAEGKLQLRRAQKFTKNLQKACDNAQLAVLLPSLKRLKLLPTVFHRTHIGEALADAKKRVRPSPAVGKAAMGLLERWRVAAAEQPSVSVARHREANMQSESKQECFALASSVSTSAEVFRRAPRQAKLEVTRVRARTEEDMQLKQTAQLLAFLKDEETRLQIKGGRSRSASKLNCERKRKTFAVSLVHESLVRQRYKQQARAEEALVRHGREQEARAKALGVDASGGLLFPRPMRRVRAKSSPSRCSMLSGFALGSSGTPLLKDTTPSLLPLADAVPSAAIAATPSARPPATRLPLTGQKQQKLTGFFGSAGGGATGGDKAR